MPKPKQGDIVFIDTNVVLQGYALPLRECAVLRYLDIYWSPWVTAETARVATREAVKEAIAKASRSASGPNLEVALRVVRDAVNHAIEAKRHDIDLAMSLLQEAWKNPDPHLYSEALKELGDPLHDLKDVPVLAGALATSSTFLLSMDKPSFPHGHNHGTIAFWHPDTFLTTLFKDDLDLYDEVREEVGKIWWPRLVS